MTIGMSTKPVSTTHGPGITYGFMPGNDLHKFARGFRTGRRIFKDPREMSKRFGEYVEWAADNPVKITQVGWYEGEATHTEIEKPRPLTIQGFSAFCGFGSSTYFTWRKEKPDLVPAMEWIEAAMFDQKFSGAAAGLYNATLIARELGIADKAEVTGEGGAALTIKIAGPDADL